MVSDVSSRGGASYGFFQNSDRLKTGDVNLCGCNAKDAEAVLSVIASESATTKEAISSVDQTGRIFKSKWVRQAGEIRGVADLSWFSDCSTMPAPRAPVDSTVEVQRLKQT